MLNIYHFRRFNSDGRTVIAVQTGPNTWSMSGAVRKEDMRGLAEFLDLLNATYMTTGTTLPRNQIPAIWPEHWHYFALEKEDISMFTTEMEPSSILKAGDYEHAFQVSFRINISVRSHHNIGYSYGKLDESLNDIVSHWTDGRYSHHSEVAIEAIKQMFTAAVHDAVFRSQEEQGESQQFKKAKEDAFLTITGQPKRSHYYHCIINGIQVTTNEAPDAHVKKCIFPEEEER